MNVSRLSVYSGPSGDHNDAAMAAVSDVGRALAERLRCAAVTVGQPEPVVAGGWRAQLEQARPSLRALADRIDEVLAAGSAPVTAMTRCAVALATVPRVLAAHPETVVVWFDAHGDINTPADTTSGYLGGMALSGPLGWWDSDLGAGLPAIQSVLVGARDLDTAEVAHTRSGAIALVAPGPGLSDRLAEAVRGRPVYLHLDCDVLEPGTVSTDYRVPGGLALSDLATCARSLASGPVVGVEVAEYEGADRVGAAELVDAIAPLL